MVSSYRFISGVLIVIQDRAPALRAGQDSAKPAAGRKAVDSTMTETYSQTWGQSNMKVDNFWLNDQFRCRLRCGACSMWLHRRVIQPSLPARTLLTAHRAGVYKRVINRAVRVIGRGLHWLRQTHGGGFRCAGLLAPRCR